MPTKTLSKTNQLYKDTFPGGIVALTTETPYDYRFVLELNNLSPQQISDLKHSTGMAFPRMANIRQVHGHRVVAVDNEYRSGEEADALITKTPDFALVIRTADCLPVFLYDVATGAIGLVHAGWKSTQQKIVGETVQAMQRHFGTKASDLTVAFGPAIRRCCFEVGEEFREIFPEDIFENEAKLFVDLASVNRRQLTASGVQENRISDCEVCTVCDKAYFSYRRQGESAGRMLSLMMIRPDGGQDV